MPYYQPRVAEKPTCLQRSSSYLEEFDSLHYIQISVDVNFNELPIDTLEGP